MKQTIRRKRQPAHSLFRQAVLSALAVVLTLSACNGASLFGTDASGSSAHGAPSDTLSATPPSFSRAAYPLTLLVGPNSGMSFSVGRAVAALLTDAGYPATAAATGGTAENINALRTDQGNLAMASADSVTQAIDAVGPYEGQEPATDLHAMMSLWPNICQIVTTADTGIQTFADLKGKKVGVGVQNSAIEQNARQIFESNGMSYTDCDVVYLPYGESIDLMKKGQCDAAFVTSLLGNATIADLGTVKTPVLLPLGEDALRKLTQKYPFYVRTTIPKETYRTAQDIPAAAVMNVLLVSDKLSDEVVYDLLTILYSPDGLDAIGVSYETAYPEITRETALRGLRGTSIPLHPGAERFYRGNGLL